jgi:hypothetical protein
MRFFPDEFTHELGQAWDHIDKLGRLPGFNWLRGFRCKSMRDSSLGFREFATHPTLEPVAEAPQCHQSYGRAASISRLRPVQNIFDWQRDIPSPCTLTFTTTTVVPIAVCPTGFASFSGLLFLLLRIILELCESIIEPAKIHKVLRWRRCVTTSRSLDGLCKPKSVHSVMGLTMLSKDLTILLGQIHSFDPRSRLGIVSSHDTVFSSKARRNLRPIE